MTFLVPAFDINKTEYQKSKWQVKRSNNGSTRGDLICPFSCLTSRKQHGKSSTSPAHTCDIFYCVNLVFPNCFKHGSNPYPRLQGWARMSNLITQSPNPDLVKSWFIICPVISSCLHTFGPLVLLLVKTFATMASRLPLVLLKLEFKWIPTSL